VITGEPEIVGLVKVALVAVTVPVIVAPLMVGVVRVFCVSVCALSVPTTTPSPVTIPCTCVWLAAVRIVSSMLKPRAAMCVSNSRNSRPDTPWRTTAPAECATPWVLSEPRVTESVVPEPAVTVTTSSLEVSGSTISV
jgi:hypothetical protein